MISTSIATVPSLSRQKAQFSLTQFPKMINMKCKSGFLSTDLTLIKMGYMRYFRDAADVENIWSRDCSNFPGLMTSIQGCEGETSCQISYKPYWFIKECWNKLGINQNGVSVTGDEVYKGYLNLPCISKQPNIPTYFNPFRCQY